MASVWQCSAEEYHADTTHVSHSALDVFRQSRRLYHGRFITGEIERPEPTPAMRLGTLLHLAVLEPERFEVNVVSAPECDRRTKDGKAVWAAFCEESVGKVVASLDDMNLCRALMQAVKLNSIAAHWLGKGGHSEHTITWQDQEIGLLCKSRRDRFIESDNLLLDLKTCRDASPEAFAKAAASFGYNRQSAWYVDGHKAAFGAEPRFLFIAICTQPPHEVACYELDADAIDLGRRQNRTALFQLADCIEHDDWLGPHEKQVTTLSLPRWANYSDWEMA